MKKYVVIDIAKTWELIGGSPYHLILENIQQINDLLVFGDAAEYSGTEFQANSPKAVIHFNRNDIVYETDSTKDLLERYFVELL